MGAIRKAYKVLDAKTEDHSGDLGIGGKIIFEWILRKYGGKMWTGCI
jgi:hypothetical protein